MSRERITAELRKLLSARDPAPAVAAMAQSGVLAASCRGPIPARWPRWSISTRPTCRPAGLRRLAVLGGETARLRLSKAEARDLTALRDALGSRNPRRAGLASGGRLAVTPCYARAAASGTAPCPRNWQPEVQRGAKARFPVTAADLMPALQGPALGARLKALGIPLACLRPAPQPRGPAERGVTIRRDSATEVTPKKETSMEHGIPHQLA
jgi:poly(A) polymerase